MSSDFAKISAQIYLLRPEEGRRKPPIFTGYRPTVYFGDRQMDGLIVFNGEEKPALGGEYRVTLCLAHLEIWVIPCRKMPLLTAEKGQELLSAGKI